MPNDELTSAEQVQLARGLVATVRKMVSCRTKLPDSKVRALVERKRKEWERNHPVVRPDLLLAYARRLTANVMSGDAIWLSIIAAMEDVGASKEEGEELLRAARLEVGSRGSFPKGFFSEVPESLDSDIRPVLTEGDDDERE